MSGNEAPEGSDQIASEKRDQRPETTATGSQHAGADDSSVNRVAERALRLGYREPSTSPEQLSLGALIGDLGDPPLTTILFEVGERTKLVGRELIDVRF